MIDLHEKLQGKINDKTLAMISIGNLGISISMILEKFKMQLYY